VSDDERIQIHIELSKNIRHSGIAVLGFVGILLGIKFGNNIDELDFFIMISAIASIILLSTSPLLLIVSSRKSRKKD